LTDLDIRPCFDSDTRRKYVSDGPIDFESWLEMALKMDTELVRGVIIDRMAAQYPHEWIFAWLFKILGAFVGYRKLGVVLGSRTAVKIGDNDGRLPDILFVRAENVQIIQNDAIYGVPDIVIEIISENDRPYNLVPLEADYRAIGVPEIAFIDPHRKRVRFLRKSVAGYDDAFLTTGPLEFMSVPGFWVNVEWLFADEKPDEYTITKQLIEAVDA
jgi:Uma2 family endonuclease